jgi:hypothetical protein
MNVRVRMLALTEGRSPIDEKREKLQPGTVRLWKDGVRMQKQKDGSWRPLPKDNGILARMMRFVGYAPEPEVTAPGLR